MKIGNKLIEIDPFIVEEFFEKADNPSLVLEQLMKAYNNDDYLNHVINGEEAAKILGYKPNYLKNITGDKIKGKKLGRQWIYSKFNLKPKKEYKVYHHFAGLYEFTQAFYYEGTKYEPIDVNYSKVRVAIGTEYTTNSNALIQIRFYQSKGGLPVYNHVPKLTTLVMNSFLKERFRGEVPNIGDIEVTEKHTNINGNDRITLFTLRYDNETDTCFYAGEKVLVAGERNIKDEFDLLFEERNF
ncbi:hypothetical protein [Priestia megaterium]|uniref:hypothetical protein n=1 Tax=Priestia megaterium TaxID=1404 RepID=UPI00194F5A93|nr:hypothetical protein [Priestia megaterium]MBM6602207.1 hypothetical protein [Priestia megaterium]